MTDALRRLDEEIALARGWVRRERTSGILVPGAAWIAPSPEEGRAWGCERMNVNGVSVNATVSTTPPPFSSSWALAGILFEEMASDEPRRAVAVFHDCETWVVWQDVGELESGFKGDGATPSEAVSRAWLDWRRAKETKP